MMKKLTYLIDKLLNTRAAAVYFILFAIAIGWATFIENDFGTDTAQNLIYKSLWFEILLLLFGASSLYQIFVYRMIQNRKWSLATFHSSLIIIILGAGITRYYGYEGIMHIREGSRSNTFESATTHLNFNAKTNSNNYQFSEEVLFGSVGSQSFEESYLIENQLVNVKLIDFIPNPTTELIEDSNGAPILKLVVAGSGGREEYLIEYNSSQRIQNKTIGFGPNASNEDFVIQLQQDGRLFFKTNQQLNQRVMATQSQSTIQADDTFHPLALRALYSNNSMQWVFPEYLPKAIARSGSSSSKISRGDRCLVKLQVSVGNQTKVVDVYGSKGLSGVDSSLVFDQMHIDINYGSKTIDLPFAIHLNDFIMDKYPGTNSASSYASEVVVIDPFNGKEFEFRIFMNNILNYGGYRFFQSSFDRDEKGTYLSVNHDYWGTFVTYIGYFLLTLGMIMTFFDKKTRFYALIQKLKNSSSKATVLLLLGMSFQATAQTTIQAKSISEEHAKNFSELVVQDHRGRFKPLHTLSRELLRKIYRKTSIDGLNADQIILSMFANPQQWNNRPIVKLGQHPEVLKLLQTSNEYASYQQFFDEKGRYRLQNELNRIQRIPPKQRGTYDKELLKIDERLNILNMVFSGSIFKVFADPSSSSNSWLAFHNHAHGTEDRQSKADAFFNSYRQALVTGISNGNFNHADHLLSELRIDQQLYWNLTGTNSSRIQSEILLNKLSVFNRLAGIYFIIGLLLLGLLFYQVFYPQKKISLFIKGLLMVLLVGFIFHTLGLGLRWYVSARAPWSNGYESMIYIAWTASLAGLLFARKSLGGLTATVLLAAIFLGVSGLSFLDPEITPLVPVLKSYWLTIHVSLEAGSYGFLLLGALIGLINLALISAMNSKNKQRVKSIVKQMSYRSELILIVGLFMLSIGTYLGGIWANESWGRYWGWDAKETWALVSILVYAFILHMRFVPGLKGFYKYNVASVIGLYSIVMTYFGVNYYLSGLHSYATGDPVPIPTWAYYLTAFIILLSLFAHVKKKKYW